VGVVEEIERDGGEVMGSNKQVEVTIAEIVTHTDKALLVRQGDDTEAWVPYSQIREFKDMLLEEIEEGLEDLETITLPEWLAVQKGLV
jgi:predicted house-cleaning noncanonical NTP pyrophosphatase (MazG superfamily)